jgi:uncharacterized protein YhaN
MGRVERKLLRINDELAALERDRYLVAEELEYHRHINDDAQRDAAVSDHPLDRADARQTAADVARFEARLAELDDRRQRLIAKRGALLAKLD